MDYFWDDSCAGDASNPDIRHYYWYVLVEGEDDVTSMDPRDRLVIRAIDGGFVVCEWITGVVFELLDTTPVSPKFSTLAEAKEYYLTLCKIKYGIDYD